MVTYGTTNAPYSSACSLLLVATEAMNKDSGLSAAASSIIHDTSVDDYLSGSDTLVEGCQRIKEVSNILDAAGLHLRKWCSNTTDILNSLK